MQDLFRKVKDNFQPHKVIIIGNGAVQNGWMPMMRAIKKSNRFRNRTHLNDLELSNIIDLIPSLAVHEYNLFRGILIQKLNRDLDAEMKVTIINRMVDFFDLIEHIGHEYDSAILPFTEEIDKIKALTDENTGVITLNYDNSVWNHTDNSGISFKNVIQLHGRGSIPESLYFPTDNSVLDEITNVAELISDSLKKQDFVSSINNSIREKLQANSRIMVRRQIEIGKAFRKIHNMCMDWLSSANEIVVWGVGLNTYDSEFLSLVNATSENRKDKIKLTVINPNDNTIEKTRIFFNVSDMNLEIIKPEI